MENLYYSFLDSQYCSATDLVLSKDPSLRPLQDRLAETEEFDDQIQVISEILAEGDDEYRGDGVYKDTMRILGQE